MPYGKKPACKCDVKLGRQPSYAAVYLNYLSEYGLIFKHPQYEYRHRKHANLPGLTE